MRSLILALAACSLAVPTTACASMPLGQMTKADEQLGISVELAYQAAALAERTAVRAHLVTPAEAQSLLGIDQQAYRAVCLTRTAYNVTNGQDPKARNDGCPADTKSTGAVGTYAEVASQAIDAIRTLMQASEGMSIK